MALKDQIQDDMKAAMRSGEKSRLGTIRMLMAAIKQREVDERITLKDNDVIQVIEKMVKQRRESIKQYRDANREDLAAVEEIELAVLAEYMPESLSESELAQLIEDIIQETGATSMQDMGKVMGLAKSRAQGRADMSAVSAQVKARLAS